MKKFGCCFLVVFVLMPFAVIAEGGARSGYLDLSWHDFGRDGTARLDGEWNFFWKGREVPGEISVPGSWEGNSVGGEVLPLYGHGVYRLKVRLPGVEEIYALRINRIFTAYELFVDGRKVASSGHPGTSAAGSAPKMGKKTVCFKTDERDITLEIIVSNYHYYKSGVVDSIELGTQDQVHGIVERRQSTELLLAGLVFGIGLYHIMLYLVFRGEKSPVFFGVICLMVFLQIVFEGEMLFSRTFPYLGLQQEETMQTIEHCVFVPCLLHMYHHMFERRVSALIMIVFDTASLVVLSCVIFLPFEYLYRIWDIYTPMVFFVIAYLVLFLFRCAWQRMNNGLVALGGFIFFGLTACNDILVSLKVINMPFILVYGLLVLFMCQCVIIARQYRFSFHRVEVLSGELARRNIDLQDAYSAIEIRVDERTEELRLANEKIVRMNRQLLKEKTSLEKEVITDNLTGLSTRNFAMERLVQEIDRADTYPVSICMIDIDHFKKINDTRGHPFGDTVLKNVADIMKKHCRKSDIIARYGGEEFILILPETGINECRLLAERIRRTMENFPWEHSLVITLSAGISQYDGESAEELVLSADNRLYQAKKMGRNQVAG